MIRNAKFGDSSFNFFWAYEYDGLVVWHPDPSKIGTNRSNVVYPNGIKMVPKFIEIARSPRSADLLNTRDRMTEGTSDPSFLTYGTRQS